MTRAGKSIYYFGYWVLLCAIFLMVFPEFSLGIAGMSLSDYIMVRLFGMVLLYLAIYYFLAGKRPEFWPFFQITILTRYSALLFVIVFILLGLARPVIIWFVIIDALGATWTLIALNKDKKDGLLK